MVINEQAAKRDLSVSSQGVGMPFHGRSTLLHRSHSHRKRRARLKACKSLIPRPPNFFGAQILFQFTRHLPPFASSSAAHKKFLLILSNLFTSHLSAGKVVRKYVAVDVMTELTSSSLPFLFSSFPFHPFKRPCALSSSG